MPECNNDIRASVIYVVGRKMNKAHYPVVTICKSRYTFAPKLRVSQFPVVCLETNSDVTVEQRGDAYVVCHAASGTCAEVRIDVEKNRFSGKYLTSRKEFSGTVEGLTVSLSDDEIGKTITAMISLVKKRGGKH